MSRVYVFVHKCGCVTGATTGGMVDVADLVGRTVECVNGPVSIPQCCAEHSTQTQLFDAAPSAERGGEVRDLEEAQ